MGSTMQEKQGLLAANGATEATKPVPVRINVYDLTPYNSLAYWLGLGIYHSGVEVHGVEYGFGYHEQSTSGIFEVPPHECPDFTYRTTIEVGTTDLEPLQVRQMIERATADYPGDSYHLLLKNCNHFTEDIVERLTKKRVPGWVNRLAKIGWISRCCLPDFLQGNLADQFSEFDRSEVTSESTAGKDVVVPNDDIDIQQQQQDHERLLPE